MNRLPVTLLALACLMPLTQGCASECKQVRAAYDEALAAEMPFSEQGQGGGTHFALAVKDEVLNEAVRNALGSVLGQGLSIADEIALASGKTIGVKTEGAVADLAIFPDASCEECLRVEGRLDGKLSVKLPLLGVQSVPLGGAFRLVAPVVFGEAGAGRTAVKLDLAKVAELNQSRIDPEVTQLPPTWWKVLKGPLGKKLLEASAKSLPAVTLLEFDGPDLGIDGLKVAPVLLRSDPKRGVLFVGFGSNLAARAPAGVEAFTALPTNSNIAVGVDSSVLPSLLTAFVQAGKLDRRYDKKGKPDPNGPAHVTVRHLTVDDAAADGPIPFRFGFRLWNLPSAGQCYWADAEATGQLSFVDGQVTSSIEKVELGESSLSGVVKGLAEWATSTFVIGSGKVVTKTLDKKAFEFPGGTAEMTKGALTARGGALWLEGAITVTEPATDESAEDD